MAVAVAIGATTAKAGIINASWKPSVRLRLKLLARTATHECELSHVSHSLDLRDVVAAPLVCAAPQRRLCEFGVVGCRSTGRL
jgi:hypothetical protein